MEKFELTLRNAKLRSYHVISWLLIFLNIVALYIYSFSSSGGLGDRFGIIGTFLLALLLLFVRRTDRFSFPDRKMSLLRVNFLIIILWLRWQLYIPAAATFVFELLYSYSVRKFEVLVEKKGIIYPSFPKRKILWNELQNIILKDGILTIDLKNNKLIQQELEEDDAVNEKEFNEFCKQQLSK
jgi:hypothetical protein